MKVSKSKSVSIDADTAKHVCELFDSIELADKFFKSCQNTEFRQHVKGVYKAQHVAQAFIELKALLADKEAAKVSEEGGE